MLNHLINGGRMELAAEYISSDTVNHDAANRMEDLGASSISSRCAASYSRIMRNTMEDIIIAEGDNIVMRISVEATHAGTIMGIPPTRKWSSTGPSSTGFDDAATGSRPWLGPPPLP